jgi:hypothetical protein
VLVEKPISVASLRIDRSKCARDDGCVDLDRKRSRVSRRAHEAIRARARDVPEYSSGLSRPVHADVHCVRPIARVSLEKTRGSVRRPHGETAVCAGDVTMLAVVAGM